MDEWLEKQMELAEVATLIDLLKEKKLSSFLVGNRFQILCLRKKNKTLTFGFAY